MRDPRVTKLSCKGVVDRGREGSRSRVGLR